MMMMMMTTTLELSLKSINGSHHITCLTMSGDSGFAITGTQVGWFEATSLGY